MTIGQTRKTKDKPTTTSEDGRDHVRHQVISRGASRVEEEIHGRSVSLRVWNQTGDHQVRIRVRTRKSGDWHASLVERDPRRDEHGIETFWVFVDLSVESKARYFIVPEWWMRRDIHHHHEGYLIRHGGVRPEEPESDHHAIEQYRIKKWEDEWQLLGLQARS